MLSSHFLMLCICEFAAKKRNERNEFFYFLIIRNSSRHDAIKKFWRKNLFVSKLQEKELSVSYLCLFFYQDVILFSYLDVTSASKTKQ